MEVFRITNGAALDRELTELAEAIRKKGGTSDSLTFPGGGFRTAVEALPRPKQEQARHLVVRENGVRYVTPDLGCTLRQVKVTTEVPPDPRFDSNISGRLKGVVETTADRLRPYAIWEGVTELIARHASSVMHDSVALAKHLTRVTLGPTLTGLQDRAFADAQKLTSLDLQNTYMMLGQPFVGCSSLQTIILRTLDCTCMLQSSEALAGSAITHVCVPRSMLKGYLSDTNWSRYAGIIVAIEDHPELTGGSV